MPRSKTTWKKGQSGNPNGPPPLLPEVRQLMSQYKNEVKTLVAKVISMSITDFNHHSERTDLSVAERLLCKCVQRIENDGYIDGYIKLMELVTGRLVEEPQEFEISDKEKEVIIKFREWEIKQAKLDQPK